MTGRYRLSIGMEIDIFIYTYVNYPGSDKK
jgi:hypothetical protein